MKPLSGKAQVQPQQLAALNAALASLSAEQRVAWAFEHLPG
ncbi:MAG: phosphoadenosine phosphosulfate reductase, partial [Rhodanobacter sp.]